MRFGFKEINEIKEVVEIKDDKREPKNKESIMIAPENFTVEDANRVFDKMMDLEW
jgi:hypothetical protein